jgi:DNA (cytosine-5)-methyltransferase 1
MRHVTNGTFPRWAIWENVAGALSSNNGRDFAAVISEMAEAGAVLQEYALLDAQYFGIPQRRRRVFLVACFDSAIARNCPDPLLPVSESLRGNTAKGKSKGQAVASETSAGFTSSSFAQYAEGVGTLRSNGGDLGGGSETLIAEPMLLDGTRVDDVRVYEPPVQTLKERMGTGGNNVPMLAFDTQFGSNANVFEDQSPTLKASQQSPSVAYDEYNDTISPVHHALRAGTKQSTGVLEPTMAVRRLTPLECERLMGWPDDHTRWKADGTEQADTHRYKQCGNGVASPVARWIAQHILKAHQ